MQKLRIDRFAAVAGLLVLSAAVIAYACTTKSASLVGRVSTAAAPAAAAIVPAGGTAPASSSCQASGETCYMFEIMSATDADGKAIADLTGKTMKAKYAKNVAMPANWTNETIVLAKADLDWDNQMIQVASMETAPEAVAVAAKANWEKYAVATASTMPAGGKPGCCAAGAKASAASAKGASCAAKADAATASAKGASCAGKTDAATASSGKGSCAGKADAATAGGKGTCHSKTEASAAAARALVLNVSGMTCGGCASKVEKALMGVKGVASAKVDLEAHNAKVDVAKEVKAEDLVKAIEAVGFKAEIASVPAAEAPAKG